MRRFVILSALALVAAITSGCSNSCEKLCVRLADYAEECNYTVKESELTECLEVQKEAPEEDLDACQDFNDPVTIRREWSCEELQVYWDGGGDDA